MPEDKNKTAEALEAVNDVLAAALPVLSLAVDGVLLAKKLLQPDELTPEQFSADIAALRGSAARMRAVKAQWDADNPVS